MIAILINLLPYLPYILLAYFVYQFVNRNNSEVKSIDIPENFAQELEQGPFGEEQDQTYNLPQPSDPLAVDGPIQPGTQELDRQYDESRIGLGAKQEATDVEESTSAPVSADSVEEEFTHRLLHAPFNTIKEETTSAPISDDDLETTTDAPLME